MHSGFFTEGSEASQEFQISASAKEPSRSLLPSVEISLRDFLQKATKETKDSTYLDPLRCLRFLLSTFFSYWQRCCGLGWMIKRESRHPHRVLLRPGWSDVVFAFPRTKTPSRTRCSHGAASA
jgi:hypothetical protein